MTGQVTAVCSADAGETFGGPPLDSATATRGKYGIWWLGDWQGLASGAGAFHLIWNDTRTGKLDLFAASVHR